MKTNKNSNTKKIIIIIIISVSLICISSIVIVKNSIKPTTQNNINHEKIENTEKENMSKDTEIKNITTNNILFSNIKYSYDGNISILSYEITNNSNQAINLTEYEIIIIDKNNNILANLTPSITKELQPNESIKTENTININVNNMKKLEIKENK